MLTAEGQPPSASHLLTSQILSIPRFASLEPSPTSPPQLPRLLKASPTQSAAAPQNRRVDPDPTTGHPQSSLSGALLCGCGARKHDGRVSREHPLRCARRRSPTPPRQLHVDAERPQHLTKRPATIRAFVPDNKLKDTANWIGPLVTRSTQGCRLPFGFTQTGSWGPCIVQRPF